MTVRTKVITRKIHFLCMTRVYAGRRRNLLASTAIIGVEMEGISELD
jgi:hypothetical protein